MEALGAVDFTNGAVSNHYFLRAVVEVKNPVSLSSIIYQVQLSEND